MEDDAVLDSKVKALILNIYFRVGPQCPLSLVAERDVDVFYIFALSHRIVPLARCSRRSSFPRRRWSAFRSPLSGGTVVLVSFMDYISFVILIITFWSRSHIFNLDSIFVTVL